MLVSLLKHSVLHDPHIPTGCSPEVPGADGWLPASSSSLGNTAPLPRPDTSCHRPKQARSAHSTCLGGWGGAGVGLGVRGGKTSERLFPKNVVTPDQIRLDCWSALQVYKQSGERINRAAKQPALLWARRVIQDCVIRVQKRSQIWIHVVTAPKVGREAPFFSSWSPRAQTCRGRLSRFT